MLVALSRVNGSPVESFEDLIDTVDSPTITDAASKLADDVVNVDSIDRSIIPEDSLVPIVQNGEVDTRTEVGQTADDRTFLLQVSNTFIMTKK